MCGFFCVVFFFVGETTSETYISIMRKCTVNASFAAFISTAEILQSSMFVSTESLDNA